VFAGATVYFPVSGNGSFAGTTLSAPAGVHTMLVTGLAPGAAYNVSIEPGGSGNVISIAPGGTRIADSAGVLSLSF
jgi:hypothetical protein